MYSAVSQGDGGRIQFHPRIDCLYMVFIYRHIIEMGEANAHHKDIMFSHFRVGPSNMFLCLCAHLSSFIEFNRLDPHYIYISIYQLHPHTSRLPRGAAAAAARRSMIISVFTATTLTTRRRRDDMRPSSTFI